MKPTKDKSPIPWLGGKSKIAQEIVKLIPEDHKCYVEPFFGGGSVFFRKPPSIIEIVSDLNGILIALVNSIKHYPIQLAEQFENDIISQELFYRYETELKMNVNQETLAPLTDIEKAHRLFYGLKTSFGGLGRTFGFSMKRKPSLNLEKIVEVFREAQKRLLHVQVLKKDYRETLEFANAPEVFAYADPPYLCGTSRNYIESMGIKDYHEMKEILMNWKGRFLLSINDHPEIRKIFSTFNIGTIETWYSVGKTGRGRRNELLISNY